MLRQRSGTLALAADTIAQNRHYRAERREETVVMEKWTAAVLTGKTGSSSHGSWRTRDSRCKRPKRGLPQKADGAASLDPVGCERMTLSLSD